MPVAISNLKATWSNSSLAFTAISMNVANNGSNADSRLLDLKVDGSSKQFTTPNGDVFITGFYHGDGSMLTGISGGGGGGTTDNIARLIANTAYDKANSANILAFQVSGAVTTANTIASSAYDKANAANLLAFSGGGSSVVASAAYDKANAANLLAFNTGIGANTYLLTTIAGANTAVGAGANAFSAATIAGANTAVGAGANTYLLATISGANTAVGAGANTYLLATIAGANTAVGAGANTYLLATITGANTAVGTGANTYLLATIAGANTAVGAGANTYLLATLSGANTAVGTGANTYLLATIAGANTAVGTGANTYLLATIAGANTAVGAGANTYLLATIAGANTAVGTGANNYLLATIAGANTAVGAGANAFAVATFNAANTRPVGNTLASAFTSRSTRRTLNFIPGTNITINVDDDSAGDRSNVTINSTASGGGIDVATLDGANTVSINAFNKANSANLLAFAALPNVTNVSFAGNLFFPTGNVSIGNTVIDSDARLTIDGNVRMFSSKSLQLILEADTDNSDEQDYPRILLKQDGNTRVTHIGYVGNTSNDFEIETQDFNSLRLGTSGNPRLTIDGTGNVGIDTTSPLYKLDVRGVINASSVLINGSPISGGSLSISEDAVNATRYLTFGTSKSGILATANVSDGITFNPGSNALTTRGAVEMNVASLNADFYFNSFGGSGRRWLMTSSTGGSWALYDSTGSNNRINVSGSGGIDFYTASGNLTHQFTTYSGTNSFNLYNPSGNLAATIYSDANHMGMIGSQGNFYISNISTNDPDIIFQIGPSYTERMRVANSGNVGIGTNDPLHKLDVVGTINAASILINGSPVGNVTTITLNGANTAVGGGANTVGIAAFAKANAAIANTNGVTTAGNFVVNGQLQTLGSPGTVTGAVVQYLGTQMILTPNTANWGTSIRIASTADISNDTIAIYSGNKLTAIIDSSANVLIGRTTSTVGQNVKLDVNGAVNASSMLVNGTPLITNALANTAGITTAGALNVSGAVTANGITHTPQNGALEGAEFIMQGAGAYDDWTVDLYANQFRVFTSSANTNLFNIFNNGTANANMIVDGVVGIGTASPQAGRAISLNGPSNYYGISLLVNDVVEGQILQESTGSIYFDAGYTTNTGAMVFRTNTGKTRMAISKDGDIAIGSSNPANASARYLDVYNTGADNSTAAVLRLITANTVSASGLAVVDIIKYKSGPFYINNGETDPAALIGFGLGGTQRMTIDSNGSVGIAGISGHSTNKLEVYGDGNRLVSRSSTTAGLTYIEAQASTYWSTPTFTGTSIRQYGSASAGTSMGISQANLGELLFQNGSAGAIYTNGGAPLAFGTVSVERMRITQSGLIGIGTITPSANLQVNGSFFVTVNNTSSLDVTGEIAEFAHNSNTYAQLHVRNANTGTRASGDLVVTADVGTDSTDFIDLGINGSTYNDPAFTIAVAKDGYLYTSNGNLAIGTANTGKFIRFFTGGTLAANERLRIDPSGNVGIGRTTPTANLDVLGSVNAAIYLINNTFANATPATVNAASSNAVYTTPGTQRFHPSAAKFWIKADVAGAIQGSHGVSSIVDVGVGTLNVVFSTAFTTTNYSVVSMVLSAGGTSNTAARVAFANSSALPLTTGCQLNAHNLNGVVTDPVNWFAVGYGNIV